MHVFLSFISKMEVLTEPLVPLRVKDHMIICERVNLLVEEIEAKIAEDIANAPNENVLLKKTVYAVKLDGRWTRAMVCCTLC